MDKFIYVFDEDSRDELIKQGFKLLKSDKSQNVFVFLNEEREDINFEQLDFTTSNTLTF